jgi:hypothetical protein
MRHICRGVTAVILLATVCGCTVFDRKNRVLLNSLDAAAAGTFLTETRTARVIAAPLALPVGFGAGAVDMLLYTPARQFVPAYHDTIKSVWENPEGSDFRQAVLFLPKVVMTPVVYAGTWTIRALFTGDN